MFSLLTAMFKRLIVSLTSPFRMLIVQIQRMFNVNVIAARVIRPLNAAVRKMLRLRPSEKSDYVRVGSFFVFKQLFALIVLVLCAGVFIYFTMFAEAVEAPPAALTGIRTNVSFRYDDIGVKDFTGTANIISYDGAVVYTGEIVSGVCEGNGILYARDGSLLYEGGFAENSYNGEGTLYGPDGAVIYEGAFADNLYHGAGKLYNANGVLVYSGSFASGSYEGPGRLYDQGGNLLYEGDFSDGRMHGTGVRYSSGGVLNYEGEFFEDVFQGNGQLYDENGGLIYTGLMHAGEINYRAMVGATLAELDGAFAETPGIYYQEEGESCFFYEKAGVIVTVDCRTRVDEWKREGTDPSGGLYYMPGEETPPPENDAIEGGEAADGTKVIEVPPAQPPADNSVEPQSGLSAVKTAGPVTAASTRAKAAGTVLTPVNWVVMDPYTPESSEDDESEKADESSSASSAPSEASAPPGETGLNADRARLPETPESGVSEATADDGGRSLLPEFIERTKELYFEIDADVWQPESSLDKSKVLVKRVTVIAYKNLPPVAAGAVSVEDNGMPGVEDCVAIDSIRFRVPAAFAGVTFEIDKQNKLFRQVWNINYANRVEREGYLAGDLIFRYAYIPEDDSAPAYYSIEAQ